jgi:hypothetical protein
LVDISLGDFSRPPDFPPSPERQRPTGRAVMLALVLALLLAVVAVHARRPVRPHLPAGVAYELPPEISTAVVRASRGYFLLDLPARQFTYVVSLASTTAWPVLVTRLRLDLPAGLHEVDSPVVTDSPPAGRLPARLSIPVQLVANVPVQVIVRLAVDCDRLAAIRAVPARILVAASVGERTGEVDLMADLVMFGQTWSASLASEVCHGSDPSPGSGSASPGSR